VDVIEAVTGRRSVGRLVEPAPGDGELLGLLERAMTAPDHGMLRPWRLVLVRGDARHALAPAFADTVDGTAEERARAAGKPLRAPLLVSIVFTPKPSPKVPEWEQLAATSAMIHTLGLLLHAQGWASIWRTGRVVESGSVRAALALEPAERLLGWLYVGTPDPAQRCAPRAAAAPEAYVSLLRSVGRVDPLVPLAGRR
jgi:nitroreductase